MTECSALPDDISDVYITFWVSIQANGDNYSRAWEIGDIDSLMVD